MAKVKGTQKESETVETVTLDTPIATEESAPHPGVDSLNQKQMLVMETVEAVQYPAVQRIKVHRITPGLFIDRVKMPDGTIQKVWSVAGEDTLVMEASKKPCKKVLKGEIITSL